MGSGYAQGASPVVSFEIGEKKNFGSEISSKCQKDIFLPKVRQRTDENPKISRSSSGFGLGKKFIKQKLLGI